ncbi:hypothetical protein A2662_02590 [Candidatus Giovannonibacteria bacterium RIFCSPHIGHO2_01_FULL_45_33]|uniref:Addiction module toxin RelE n=1 Tax=Candidatus Giovannonibacteria bacterium RIFCSPLOWO2_01_FULL_45_34 TaxID=1798351 RepID=A0A1F5WYH4_9BACT|nr:MAG: hypothetical protein A2662_02590 [Candidatus Giovannonibacteria bacterium RIFCSPHIGHO2_01_FULL_45_33]OGF70968.1 MAG: hypothetical protein A3C73_04050 [Candidatus Giovannonibacteria bacterium RIFCSPHIGHO2_02_FULL_44_11]OGF80687.1 MAG: hypothetical protein A2930_01815 [Candidatus Giovannonibacteria bacterium RIFCSPLOWO2_01_FULL_45_34]
MNWQVGFSFRTEKFLIKNHLPREKVFVLVKNAILKFNGEDINIDLKKLKGKWAGFFRIRKGDMRIIVSFDFDKFSVFVDVVDWRGGAYK